MTRFIALGFVVAALVYAITKYQSNVEMGAEHSRQALEWTEELDFSFPKSVTYLPEVIKLADESLPQALEALKVVSILQLDKGLVEKYLGTAYSDVSAEQFYLVRAFDHRSEAPMDFEFRRIDDTVMLMCFLSKEDIDDVIPSARVILADQEISNYGLCFASIEPSPELSKKSLSGEPPAD